MKTKSSKLFAGFLSLVLATAVIALIAGCNTTQPSKTSVAATVVEPPASKGGAQLWSENCALCHNLRSPSTYSDAEWDVAMHHMRVRANLTAQETRVIQQFLKVAN